MRTTSWGIIWFQALYWMAFNGKNHFITFSLSYWSCIWDSFELTKVSKVQLSWKSAILEIGRPISYLTWGLLVSAFIFEIKQLVSSALFMRLTGSWKFLFNSTSQTGLLKPIELERQSPWARSELDLVLFVFITISFYLIPVVKIEKFRPCSL